MRSTIENLCKPIVDRPYERSIENRTKTIGHHPSYTSSTVENRTKPIVDLPSILATLSIAVFQEVQHLPLSKGRLPALFLCNVWALLQALLEGVAPPLRQLTPPLMN